MSSLDISDAIGSTPTSFTAWATETLRRAIILGKLNPGAPIGIKETAEQFGVSVTPLREALQRLASTGLVYQSNRRFFVSKLSRDDLSNLYELRQQLEPQAVEHSVLAADDSWLASLQRVHAKMEGAVGPNNEKFEIAHREFHRTLIERAPSAYLRRFVGELLDGSSRYRILAIQHTDYTMMAHDELYQAGLRRDSRAAHDAALDHIVTLTQSQMEKLYELGFLDE